MNFDFSPDQKELQAHARRILSETCPREVLRSVIEGDAQIARATWRTLGETGFLGLGVPEGLGGAGLGDLDLCLVAQEVGRALAPLPMSSSVYQVLALLLGAADPQRQAWVPGLARGDLIGCVVEDVAEGSSERPLTFDGGTLNGVAASVLDAGVADLAVVALGPAAVDGLLLVDLRQPAVGRTSTDRIDLTRGRARLSFDAASAEQICSRETAPELFRDVRDRAAILIAFEQIGGAERCLEMARDYALQRHAFGRPIGAYQAIQHKLVDMFAMIRLATAHAHFAAWALATGSDTRPRAAAAAFVAAGEAFNFAAQENIQAHGAIGYTWEHDAHLFYRRARALSLEFGAMAEWRERLAASLLDAPESQGKRHGLR